MKMKHFFVGLVATLSLGAATAAGVLISNKKNTLTEVKADSITWYLRGDINGWNVNNDYIIVDGGDPLIVDLEADQQFKVADESWDNQLTTSDGDASGNGITFTYTENSVVDTAGKYAFSIKNNALYVDFGEFYYTGTDNSWGIDTGTTGNHPKVVVNGGSVEYSLSKDEEFKLRNNNTTKGVFGYSNLKNGDFYGTFKSDNFGNIVCNFTDTYNVSVSLTNRTWTVSVVPSSADADDLEYVYVLDKYGNLLNDYHNAYTWSEAGQKMEWPGAVMSTYEGTTHMFQLGFWSGMDNVVINNKHGSGNNEGYQTRDWAVSGENSVAGKCLILDGSTTDGIWDDTDWVAPQTAKFIENYMHFQDFDESDNSNGTACQGTNGYYQLAKAAYQASSFAAYREELCSLDYVVARLSAWASANNEVFNISGGVGTFASSSRALNTLPVQEAAVPATIAVVSMVSLTAIGGFFFLKKKPF